VFAGKKHFTPKLIYGVNITELVATNGIHSDRIGRSRDLNLQIKIFFNHHLKAVLGMTNY